ncbi:sialidase family protein [Palleronia rufa]|uniref:sialidase family protein n=1 Tax=Palleronia rufa TaxID=1530186 RepID=UPI001F209633|nr:sialidase family protein [Palleronia rufa]
MIEPNFRPTRRAVLTAALGIGVLAALPGVARAGTGGANGSLAFDGDALLSAGGTLSTSTDGGATWSERALPGRVLALATHRDRPGRVVAGLAEGGVGFSEDGGATWRVGTAGLPDGAVNAVAIGSRDPDLIYAAIPGDGLYKSEDAGESWTLAMDRPWLDEAERDPLALVSVDLDTGMGGIWIYAGTETGLTRVPDCFCRWQDVQPGNAMDALVAGDAPPPENPLPAGEPVLSLASSPSSPERLYAALPSGLWASRDGGVVWTQIVEESASAVAVHPEDETYVAAIVGDALKLSRDSGMTWTAAAAK